MELIKRVLFVVLGILLIELLFALFTLLAAELVAGVEVAGVLLDETRMPTTSSILSNNAIMVVVHEFGVLLLFSMLKIVNELIIEHKSYSSSVVNLHSKEDKSNRYRLL
eukprot:NODE_5_length_49639_cov_0.484336.p29 type:complete len:109 gc:universal NODE_5_length_49639_cov_0.484336:27172-27498(+)